MCRYSDHNYRSSYACLKHRHVAQYPHPHPHSLYYRAEPCCPICQQPMMHLGRDFKAPKKTNDRAWKKLAEHAYPGRFDSCGC